MTPYITVSPAYGRDYKNAKSAKADWHSGKDFVLESDGSGPNFGGQYCSIRDFGPKCRVNIRYARKTRIAIGRCA